MSADNAPERLSGKVLIVDEGGIHRDTCTTVIIPNGLGFVIIDPGSGSPESLARINRALGNHSLDLRNKVAHIMFTHMDSDHAPGANPLVEWIMRRGGEVYVYMRPEQKEKARRGDPNETRAVFYRDHVYRIPEPDRELAMEPLEIGRPGCEIYVNPVSTPGHCDDHVCYKFLEFKLLVLGDLFGGIDVFSDLGKMRDSIQLVLDLRGWDIAIDGHGGRFTRQQLQIIYDNLSRTPSDLRPGFRQNGYTLKSPRNN